MIIMHLETTSRLYCIMEVFRNLKLCSITPESICHNSICVEALNPYKTAGRLY